MCVDFDMDTMRAYCAESLSHGVPTPGADEKSGYTIIISVGDVTGCVSTSFLIAQGNPYVQKEK